MFDDKITFIVEVALNTFTKFTTIQFTLYYDFCTKAKIVILQKMRVLLHELKNQKLNLKQFFVLEFLFWFTNSDIWPDPM